MSGDFGRSQLDTRNLSMVAAEAARKHFEKRDPLYFAL